MHNIRTGGVIMFRSVLAWVVGAAFSMFPAFQAFHAFKIADGALAQSDLTAAATFTLAAAVFSLTTMLTLFGAPVAITYCLRRGADSGNG